MLLIESFVTIHWESPFEQIIDKMANRVKEMMMILLALENLASVVCLRVFIV